ncbi:hypothetical protein [Rhodanobacter aciditrophus]
MAGPTVLPLAGEGRCGFAPEQIMQAFRKLTDEVRGKRSVR